MDNCQVEGCARKISKTGHALCLDHREAERKGAVKRCTACQGWHDQPSAICRGCAKGSAGTSSDEDDSADTEARTGYLSSTAIGRHFALSNIKTNLILAELGWIEKYIKGWVPTDRGNALGANVRQSNKGIPYVVWPESILKNAALRDSVSEQSANPAAAERPPRPDTAANKTDDKSADFRAKFPATLRTQDGHMVRSRAEVLIDNWLYMQGLVHAYERRLPIEEECYCDFYLPGGKGVYIEFWGRESDPKYRERKTVKQAIYAKHGLRLIELGDAEIERLDDVLPRYLLRFGIESV